MHNPIDIDHKHNRAICQEIGERLQAYLRVEPELPASLKRQVDQLHQLEGQSPSIVPDVEHQFGNEPSSGDTRGGDQFRFTWPWRRKKMIDQSQWSSSRPMSAFEAKRMWSGWEDLLNRLQRTRSGLQGYQDNR